MGRKAGTVQEYRMGSGRQDRADLQGELRIGTAKDRVGLCHSLSLARHRQRTPASLKSCEQLRALSPGILCPLTLPGSQESLTAFTAARARPAGPQSVPKQAGIWVWRWGAGESREEVGCWSHLCLRLI